MSEINKRSLKKHIYFLKKKVFFNDSKWPHFDLLFDDLIKLSKNKKKNFRVLFLERGGLYGNISLFAPLFYKSIVTSIDCSSKNIKKRGSYNKKFVKNNEIIKWPINLSANYKKINLKNNSFDLIIIPNLLHHISEHNILFNKCFKFLKRNGRLYTFEPILREIHQAPDDYLRFTPFGLADLLKKNNFKIKKIKTSGGPFSAIAYCWDQAIQYFPKKIRKTKLKWFFNSEFKKLLKMERRYKKNKVRHNTSFPISFSVLASK